MSTFTARAMGRWVAITSSGLETLSIAQAELFVGHLITAIRNAIASTSIQTGSASPMTAQVSPVGTLVMVACRTDETLTIGQARILQVMMEKAIKEAVAARTESQRIQKLVTEETLKSQEVK